MNLLLAGALLAQIQVRQEPKDWKVLQTPHFDLHYPSDELEAKAREFAGRFEDSHADLSKKTGIETPRITVFLYRSFHDLMQSSFLGSPKPLPDRIRGPVLRERPAEAREDCTHCRPNPRSRALALAEPLRNRIFIHCQASDRWNQWFVKHELAHQFQFARAYSFRVPSWLIALKDPLIPSWWWEGGADYLAGAFDTRKDEYMRDLAAEELYTLKELHTPDILNPHDYIAIYYQGSYFWRYLDEKYGPDAGREIFHRYARSVPLASQGPLQKFTGRKSAEIEADFAAHLKQQWSPMMAGRGAPSDRLTDTREYYRRRSWGGRWSPDGKHLAWIGNADVHPELYVDGSGLLGWDRGVDGSRVVSPPSWSPDGKRIAVVEWRTNRDLLLLVDVDGGSEAVELDFDELYDPAWSPDGVKIAFAALKNGTSDLWAYYLADGRLERLSDDAAADSAPAWAPDGRLAWVKETEGRTVLHVAGQGAVTKSWALLEYPQWSPDGKEIVVAADAGGVWDAFGVDPATGKARRLTKLAGGVSYPAYHPSDGTLVVTYTGARGRDLFRIKPDPQDEPGFDQEDRKGWYDAFKKPAPRGEPAEKSRDWGVNWLQFPVLSGSFLSPGVELVVGDKDAENTLALGASGFSGRGWGAAATVANTRYRPTVGATASAWRSGDLMETRGMPFVEVPVWSTLAVGAGWVARDRVELAEEDRLPDQDFFDSGPTASFLFTNQSSYQNWDPAWGIAFGGTATFFDEDLGGDRDLEEYFGFVELSRDIVQDWILWGRFTYEEMQGEDFLEAELLEIGRVVRGAEDFEGFALGGATLELRFPILRDFLLKPLDPLGLGEWIILKDLRGFVFGDVGFTGEQLKDAWDSDSDFGAASVGAGLRLDLSFMLWPILTYRVPVRLEVWGALVDQDGRDSEGAAGFGIRLGF